MSPSRELMVAPFLGRTAVEQGLVTRSMLRGRAWPRLLPDVYVHVDAFDPNDHRMWCDAAALLLHPGSAVDGLSAAFLWGVDLLPRDAPVSLSLPHHRRIWPHPRLATNRTTLAPNDVTRLTDIPLTTPLRTAFDLGRRLPRTDAVVALDALCQRRIVTVPQLRDYATQRARWPDVRRLMTRLSMVEPLAASPMETRLRLVLLDAGAPPLTTQHEVRDAYGRFIARVDLAYPQWLIAIEYEGDHHRERAQFRRDIARVNRLRAAGWLVLRFTADDVLHRPDTVVAHVTQAIRERQ